MKSVSRVNVRRIRPTSAFRVGCLVGFLTWVFLGAIYFGLEYLSLKNQHSIFTPEVKPGDFLALYCMSLACYPIVQGIVAFCYAVAYNLSTRSSGVGLELEVEMTSYAEPEKPKSIPDDITYRG